MQFEGPPPGAVDAPTCPSDAIYTVTEVYPDHVVLDGNHPLAGIALRLALVVRDVREATEDEIEAGSVGSPASASSPRPRRARSCTDGRGAAASARSRPARAPGRRDLRASAPAPCR